MSYQDLDIAFFNDGIRLASENLSQGISKITLIELVKETYHYMDGFIKQFLEQCSREKYKVDCKKGCAYCCHQSVFVLPYEAIFLKEFCENNLTKNNFDNYKQSIFEKDLITSKLKVNEILNYTKPCPFLTDGVCSVYEARPMACRLFLSKNVSSCIQERNNPLDFNQYAQLYELPLHAGRMLNEGISAWLSENGLKPMEWFLESSMKTLLTNEECIVHWLKGENIFEPREISEEEWKYLKRYDLS